MQAKDFRDAVHGDMEFDAFELDVINTPEYQRMRGIRQLGLAHLVYPTAQHTRFEHSLGVTHMASRIVEAVRKNCGRDAITENERRFVRALALIHDIGHIPFGHTLEDERPVYDRELHHDDTVRLSLFFKDTDLGKALSALGKDIGHDDLPADLIRVMKHTHEEDENGELSTREKLLANIVGNTICADLLDYLKRDPYFTGIRHTYDERIVSAFEVRDDRIFLNLEEEGRLRRSVLSEILHLLRLRYTLGERVYYNLTKASTSAMVSKAVELSGLPHTVLAKLRDEELLYILENPPSRKVFGEASVKNSEHVTELVKKIRCRQLYRPAYVIPRADASHGHDDLDKLVETFHDPANRLKRAEIEETIAKMAGIEPSQVVVYCPDKRMSTKAAMVEVLWPKDPQPKPLEELCRDGEGIDDVVTQVEIDGLRRKHQALWQLTVFADSDCSIEQMQRISAYCEGSNEFHQIKNAIRDYAIPANQSIFEGNLRQAIAELPPDQVDNEALQELSGASFHKGPHFSVDRIREYITTQGKSERQRLLGFNQEPTPSENADDTDDT